METKLITKTIKELADEYDNNIEQQRREIRRYDQTILDQKKEIEYLRDRIDFQKLARENAENNTDTSIITMIIFCAACVGITVYNYLFG